MTLLDVHIQLTDWLIDYKTKWLDSNWNMSKEANMG